MNPVKRLLKMFPMRAERYGYGGEMCIIREKLVMAGVALLGLVASALLSICWRTDSTKPLTLVTDTQIVVDPSMTLAQMLDRGRFDTVYIELFNGGATGGKPYVAKARLFPMIGADIVRTNEAIKRSGYRPVNENELLSWGFKYPEEQRNYTVMATGKSDRVEATNCDFPRSFLQGYGGKRHFWLVCREFPSYGHEMYVLGIKE